MSENFRPVNNTPPISFMGKIKFYGRLILDLQILTIFKDMKKHLPSFKGKVLDIGCGRGEWLHILKDSNIPATGIDTNVASVQECSAQGLNVSHADAITYLSNAKEKSLGAITLFQVLEHLPFATMVHLLRLALRALVPGGVLIA